jgi:outer membrane biogenesis lipoprotein LolB
MKKLFAIFILALLTACATPSRQDSVTSYELDFKTVYQASLSALKDRNFTIKNMDWNAGEIDAYLRYEDNKEQKEIRTTVALEQNGQTVKVRMKNTKGDNSAYISASVLNETENAFFVALNKELAGHGGKK